MNERYKMTRQEAEEKMESLSEVFQVVRLIDGKILREREKNTEADQFSEMCQCYDF